MHWEVKATCKMNYNRPNRPKIDKIISPSFADYKAFFFPNFRLEFILRQAKVAAHCLAKATTNNASPAFYSQIPPCIFATINNEI